MTVDVVSETVDDVLGMVARRVGVQVTRTGTLYYLGELRPEDKGVLVRRVRRLDSDQLLNSAQVLLSEFGSASVTPDGLLIVGDRVEVLQRVVELVERVEAADAVTWVVQLHLCSIDRRDVVDIGLDAVPAIEMAYTFGAASSSPFGLLTSLDGRATLEGGLDAVLRAVKRKRDSKVVAEPLMLLVDGDEASIERGQRFPVRTRIVDTDTNTERDQVEFVQTGLQITATMRELDDRLGRLRLRVQMSDVEDLDEGGAPITSEETVTVSADVASGGVYLLGSLTQSDREEGFDVGLQTGRTQGVEDDVLFVFGRVYRIEVGQDTKRHGEQRAGANQSLE